MYESSRLKRELIDLLLYDNKESREKDFVKEFTDLLQGITDLNSHPYQTDSNVHDINSYKFNSPEFFAYLILGSVLVLPYTKVMKDLSIESIYARPIEGFSKRIEAVDLCFIVNQNGEKTAKILTFTVKYSGRKVSTPITNIIHSNKDNVDRYLAEILQDNDLREKEIKLNEFKVLVSVGDRINLESKKRVISKFKGGRDNIASEEFKKVEKTNNNINDIDQEFTSLGEMTLREKENLSIEMMNKIFSIFNLNSEIFGLSKSRITYQAFAFGAMMMNFKVKGKLNCFINSILGKDYSDLIFTMDHRSMTGATPAVVKFGEGEGQDIIDEMKDRGYDIAPLQLKSMIGKRILVGVSFLKDQPIKSEEVTVSQQENFFNQHYNSGFNFEINEDIVENFTKYIYNSIVDFIPSAQNEPAFDQKYKNYFSRLILGQLFASNLHKDIKKWIFIPDKSLNIVRFALTIGIEKKKVIILNIIEDNDQSLENILPPGDIEKCIAINIQIDPKNARYGFKSDLQKQQYLQKLTIEEISAEEISVSRGRSRGRWNPVSNSINLQTLSSAEKDSQRRQKDVEFIVSKLGKVIGIGNSLINNELDFQAMTQGIFMGVPNIVTLSEVNYGPDGRPDLALYHKDNAVSPIVIEEKFYPGNSAEECKDKLQEAMEQIKKNKYYKPFTDAHKVIRLVIQFNKSKHLEKKISYRFAEEAEVEFSTESDRSITARLFQCIEEDQYNDLKREKIDDYINYKRDGQTLLHAAVSKDRQKIVDYLLEVKYINIDIHNNDGLTPLYIAVDKDYTEIAKKLLAREADFNFKDNNGKTLLMVAIDRQNINMVTLLLDAGADVNFIDENGVPILHHAIKSKNYAMVKLLLSKGAYFDIRNEDITPATFASQTAPDSNIDKLLNHIKSAFKSIMDEEGVSNILERFEKEEVQIVLNVIDSRGNILLYYAAQKGHENVIEELIKAGADVNAIGEDNSTPLHQAAAGGYDNIVVKLIEAKADVNTIDKNINTPLHQAAKNNHKSVVRVLLDQKANISVRDDCGYDPLYLAVTEDHQDIVELLIKGGADINIIYDEYNTTPLGLAGEHNLENMAMLLIKNGAYIQPGWQAYYFKAQGQARYLIFTAVQLFEIINSDNLDEDIVKRYDNLKQKMKYEDEKIRILFSAYDNKGKTLLHYAAEKGSREIIEFLIDERVDVNIKDKDGNTALHVAAKKGHVDTVKLLLRKDAHFNISNKIGDTPIDIASDEVQKLLKNIDDLFNHAKDGSYKKASAVLQDLSTEDVRIILNVCDNKGKIPLHYVAESNHKRIVELFINKGAYFDMQDSQGKTPMDLAPENSDTYTLLQNINNLFVAIENGNQKDFSDIIERLKSQAINLNLFNSKGKILLHHAAQNDYKEITIKLIEDKVGFDTKDDEGRTPADLASENSEIKQLFQNIYNIFRSVKNGDYKNTKEILKDLSAKDIEIILIAHNSEGKTCFQYALEGKHNEMVKLLTDKGVDVKSIFNNGEIPLYTAAASGNLDIVALLIDKGADVNDKCKNGNTALHVAAEKDHIDIAELLLKHGAEFYAKNNKNKIPLGFASENSQTYKLLKSINDLFNIVRINHNKEAKKKAADIFEGLSPEQQKIISNLSDEKGNTCFLYAVKNGNAIGLQLFLTHKADYNAKNNNGEIASYLAVKEGGKDVLKLLIEYKIFNYQYDDGSTALHVAVEINNQDVLKLLIEEKASIDNFNINAKDNNGNTALHIAAQKGHADIIRLLISSGASFDVKNNNNKTPLDLTPKNSPVHLLLESIKNVFNAAKNDNVSFIMTTLKELVPQEKFIVVNARDKEGKIPLHYAAQLGNEQLVLTLIGSGSNINVENYQDNTPLDLAPEDSPTRLLLESINKIFDAARNNDELLIKTILEKLAPQRFIVVNARDKEGKTPLYYAAQFGDAGFELISMLLSNRANIDVRDNQGKTPLDLAPEGSKARLLYKSMVYAFDTFQSKDYNKVKTMIQTLQSQDILSIVIRTKDSNDMTYLHYATQFGDKGLRLVLILIGSGVSIDEKNNQGKTPLDLAPEDSPARLLLESINNIFNVVKNNDARSIFIILEKIEQQTESLRKQQIRSIIVSAKDKEGKNSLHYAAQLGNEQSVLILIGIGSSIDIVDNQGNTPLDLAPEDSPARLLLESINKVFSAVRQSDEHSIVTALVRTLSELSSQAKSIAVNAHDKEHKTPLHYVAQTGNKAPVVILINNGASIDVIDNQKKTPLDLAPEDSPAHLLLKDISNMFGALRSGNYGEIQITKQILQSNKIFNIAVKARDSNSMTYLHYIINLFGDYGIEEVRSAIENKADINAQDQYGYTPLHIAALRKGSLGIADLLIDSRANIFSTSNDGNTILHVAAGNDCKEMVKLLLKKGVCFDVENNSGKTPLDLTEKDKDVYKLFKKVKSVFYHVKNDNSDNVKEVLKDTSEQDIELIINVKNKDGNTALHIAVEQGHEGIVQFLKKKGARTDIKNKDGETALDLANSKLKENKAPEGQQKYQRIIDRLSGQEVSSGAASACLPKKSKKSGRRNRNKRATGGIECIDSREEEEIGEEEKNERIKELFNVNDAIGRTNDIEFYGELLEFSQRASEGLSIDLDVEQRFIEKVKGINLDSLDREIKDIIGGLRAQIENREETKNIFKRPGTVEKIKRVAEGAGLTNTVFLDKKGKFQDFINSNPKVMNHLGRVGRMSGWAMHGMMYKNLIGDLLSDNPEGVAINLGFIAGNPLLSKMAEAASARGLGLVSEGKVSLGKSLRMASPFLARVPTAFVIYDLANQVKALKAGNQDALVGIIGDSIYIGVDVAEIGIEVAEVAGSLEGVSSVTGPIGAAIGAVIFVGTDIYMAVKTVEAEDKIIHLTGGEKFTEGLRAFLHMKMEESLEKLMKEKQANNELVKSAIKFLKDHQGIQRYVFPSSEAYEELVTKSDYECIGGTSKYGGCKGEIRYKGEIESTEIFTRISLNNRVYLHTKRTDVEWGRARPDNPSEGELFCLPIYALDVGNGKNSYSCYNAIGVSYSVERTGNHTIIALGQGRDIAVGFKGSPNIFLVENGDKNFKGGNKDDVFILQGDNISGKLDGSGGKNTMDLANFSQNAHQLIINLIEQLGGYGEIEISPSTNGGTLKIKNMNVVNARKGKKDIVKCNYNTQYVDGGGGENKDNPDIIDILGPDDNMQLVVRPYTIINNEAYSKNFTYMIFPDMEGSAQVNLLANYHHRTHNDFIFNYTIADLKNINIQNVKGINLNIADYKDVYTVKNITFSSLLPLSDKVFNFTISNILANSNYIFNDKAQIIVGKHGNLYALQNTDKSIEEIVGDYPTIANELNMTITVQSNDKTIIVGHGKHDVLYNDPLSKNHLVGNGGENVYVITLDEKKFWDNSFSEINIYDVDKESSIDTLDLRSMVESLINVLKAQVSLLVTIDGNDLLLKPQVRIEESILESSDLKGILRLILKKGPLDLHILTNIFQKYILEKDILQEIPDQDTRIAEILHGLYQDLTKADPLKELLEYLFEKNYLKKDALKSILYEDMNGVDILKDILEKGLTVKLKNGVDWYKKLHVILNNAPVKIESTNNSWKLKPIPLIFDKKVKIIVITTNDIEEESEIIIQKQAGNYTFMRLRNDLVVMNDHSLGESNFCTVILSNFYQEPKMQTLSIKFNDVKISLQDEKDKIENAMAFCHQNLNINNILSINDINSYDCFTFDSNKVLFLKSENDLVLLSDRGTLLISGYYSSTHNNLVLSIKLNNQTIKPEEFVERANKPGSFKYYKPNNEQGLKIYHNQPENKDQIGIIDLRDKSISGCDMQVVDNSLVLLHKNSTILKIENWISNSEAREILFAFNDTIISNSKCIVSTCSPQDIITQFEQENSKVNEKVKIEDNTPHSISHKHHIGHNSHQHYYHSIEEPKVSAASSSGARQGSWLNDLFGWVKSSIDGLMGSRIASSKEVSNATPQVDTQFSYGYREKDTYQHERMGSDRQQDLTVGFSDFLSNENISLLRCVTDAMDKHPIKCYKELKNKEVEVVPSTNDVDLQPAVYNYLRKFFIFIDEKIKDLDSKEQCEIRNKIKKEKPEIITSLIRGEKYRGNVGLDDVLEKYKQCFSELLPKLITGKYESYEIDKTLPFNVIVSNPDEQFEKAQMWVRKAELLKEQKNTSRPETGLSGVSITTSSTQVMEILI
ncbi:MAG: hypothetical protein sL5_07220 [Candidatus Mesenet longicola]|uniref:Ankyrin repeat protein n=1 Tax=Candidatus Mesenet longicola TaxID=1892558 RepID=A0A8J3HVF6_9RICK|nr:MAG: hypothetical protein sGL2_07940 [Candidatus Mesenet longicola]GHM59729.1 MAG: hypothetical protein sL5_07220 [Candidatus Mesenet longicola]